MWLEGVSAHHSPLRAVHLLCREKTCLASRGNPLGCQPSIRHAWNTRCPSEGSEAGRRARGTWRPPPAPHLLGLLQQLHALPQDLAVELPALPQDLPAHLLHGGLQVLPLALAQRLAGPPPRLRLQRVVERGLQLLDFLSGPNHTDSGRSQRGAQ